MMKYCCRVLFTTRSQLDCSPALELAEIQNSGALLDLARHFYSGTEGCGTILGENIETVHRHTLAVELAARLLETGILEPGVLLNKLRAERAALDATDKIGITKDGHSRKATYYEHIHTLFSLYCLKEKGTEVMRALVFTPSRGIPVQILANWLRLSDGNTVNDLVERGFVQAVLGRRVACEEKLERALKLEQEALEYLGEITGECALLPANLHGNLGALYRLVGKLELARYHMEMGIKLLKEYGLTLCHDSITQIANYAALMADLGQPQVGLAALGKLAPYHGAGRSLKLWEGFNGIFSPPLPLHAPKRLYIVKANEYMVKHCDYLIACTWKPGNARRILEYAIRERLCRIDNLGYDLYL